MTRSQSAPRERGHMVRSDASICTWNPCFTPSPMARSLTSYKLCPKATCCVRLLQYFKYFHSSPCNWKERGCLIKFAFVDSSDDIVIATNSASKQGRIRRPVRRAGATRVRQIFQIKDTLFGTLPSPGEQSYPQWTIYMAGGALLLATAMIPVT